MEKLKILRESFDFTQEHLADILGVKSKDINDWESNKSQPELKILRDYAVYFGTSVLDILSNGKVSATTYWSPSKKEKIIDYFWGHIGILLCNSNNIKWYPITTATAQRIKQNLCSDGNIHDELFFIETLNNHYLIINTNLIKKISLIEDSSYAPKNWERIWDGDQGFGAEEYYNLIEEYFWDEEYFYENTSEEVQLVIKDLIEKNNFTKESVYDITHSINIYFSDNTSESILIGYDSKFVGTIMDIEFGVSRFCCFEDLNGEKHFISEENIGLIDIPLYLYKKQLQQFFDNE
nr:helix-turn-helix transcriptional regulator [Snodgrassella alvi]